MTLSVREISKTYKSGRVKALRSVDMELTPGLYGLLGPNGAGKSTLMNIIVGNITPDTGSVMADGTPIGKLGRAYPDKLGYMPQQQGLYDEFTAVRFMWYFAALKGIPQKVAKKRIPELLELVNLRKDAKKKLGNFSGGMKQRVLLAQALLNDPELLLLDEPTAGLDPKERVRVRNFISEMAAGKIVMLATHVVSDIEFAAKEVIFLKSGELVRIGRPADILSEFSDKVWQAELTAQEMESLGKTYPISGILGQSNGKFLVKMVSDTKPEGIDCQPAMPTLEDVYITLFASENSTEV